MWEFEFEEMKEGGRESERERKSYDQSCRGVSGTEAPRRAQPPRGAHDETSGPKLFLAFLKSNNVFKNRRLI